MSANKSRVAVVTGGGSGIGAAVAEQLSTAGHRVAVLDVNTANADAVAASIRDAGGEAIGLTVDVADRTSVDKAVAQVREKFGPIEILVTSAGVDAQTPYADISAEEWNRVIGINLTGTFNATQSIVPDMQAGGWGRIVTISSSSAQSGGPDRAHYIASKGGVIALTKALAFDFSPQGITANTIPPSIIATPMADTAVQDGRLPKLDDLAMMTPVRRTGQPEDIAAAAVFLCSEQAGFITGQVIGVNGGWYI